MKKLIAILLVITTVFALFGCENAQHTPKGTAEKLLRSLLENDYESFLDCYAYFNLGLIDKHIQDKEEKLDMKSAVAYNKSLLMGILEYRVPDDQRSKIGRVSIYYEKDVEFYELLENFCYADTEIVYAIDGAAIVGYEIYKKDIRVEYGNLYFYRIGDNWYEGSNAMLKDRVGGLD